jgi:protein SCO1/2
MENRLTARLATRHWATLVALTAILLITLLWWGLALWPLPADAPPWIARARSVCFGTSRTGLPDGTGWMTLIGQPLMMGMLLVSISGSITMRESLAGVTRTRVGRLGFRSVVLLGIALVIAAGARVAHGYGLVRPQAPPAAARVLPTDYPRLDRPAPALGLVDQLGDTITLTQLRGRPVLVTFAYAHCETVCPLVVHELLRARARLAALDPAVVVITLDPWRDTPARLPAIAAQWRLPAGALVLGGDVAAVVAELDRWNVPRARELRTGEVTHPNLVYVVDRTGMIVFATTGDADAIEQLVNRL